MGHVSQYAPGGWRRCGGSLFETSLGVRTAGGAEVPPLACAVSHYRRVVTLFMSKAPSVVRQLAHDPALVVQIR